MINLKKALMALGMGALLGTSAFGQGTAFTYQGRLNFGTNPAAGTYNLKFSLFSTNTGGSSIAPAVTENAVAVNNGLFTTLVDFGPGVLIGGSNWLQIAVATNGSSTFTNLTPRQPLTPIPYAVFAESANATNLVGTVPAANLAGAALLNSGNTFNGNQTVTGGNVGIGTLAPGAPLEVSGGNQSGGVPTLEISGPGGAETLYHSTTGGQDWDVYADNNGFAISRAGVDFPFIIDATSGNSRFINKVGIGTNAPSQTLEVNGNAQIDGTLTAASFSGSVNATNISGVALLKGGNTFTGNQTVTGGNVGIGTSVQQYNLSVGNGMNVDQNNLNGGTVQSNALVFGSNSYEGIASDRVGGADLYDLEFYTFGANRMEILHNGNVGIGTTTPQIGLEVDSTVYGQPAAQFDVANCGGPCSQTDYQEAIRLWNQNGNGQVGLGFLVGPGSFNSNAIPDVWIGTQYAAYGQGNDFKIATRTSATGTNLTDRIYLNGTTGSVGIGTTSPGTALQVNGTVTATSFTGDGSGLGNVALLNRGGTFTAQQTFKVNDTDFGCVVTDGTNQLGAYIGLGQCSFGTITAHALGFFVNNGYDSMDLNTNGCLGIGTSTPVKLLEVAGSVHSLGVGASVDPSVLLRLDNNASDGSVSTPDVAGIGFGHNSTRQAIVGGTYGNDYLAFYTEGALTAPKLFIAGNGNIGIGTTSPTYGSLTIQTQNGSLPAYNSGGILDDTGAATGFVTAGNPASLWAAGGVVANSFFAFSDERIKNIQGQSDRAADLQTLRRIQVTDYTYKDTIAKGQRPQKKIIAQQVEKVYPQAVSQSTGEVPDIYKRAKIQAGWVQLATDLKVGEHVKLITDQEAGVYPVLEVRPGAFRTDFQTTNGQVFVYGRQVNDFRTVDYEAIAMLNVSATQELARKLDAQADALKQLQTRLGATLAERDLLLKRLAVLEKHDQAREDRLAQIESALEKSSPKYALLNLH